MISADVLIHFLWPWLAFFAAIAVGSLLFRRPRSRRRRGGGWR